MSSPGAGSIRPLECGHGPLTPHYYQTYPTAVLLYKSHSGGTKVLEHYVILPLHHVGDQPGGLIKMIKSGQALSRTSWSLSLINLNHSHEW